MARHLLSGLSGLGRELPFAIRLPEWQVSGAKSGEAKGSNGSFCDMRRAGKQSFDGPTRRDGVQTSSTQAWTTGFARPRAARDGSSLEADITAFLRAEPRRPRGALKRTSRRQV